MRDVREIIGNLKSNLKTKSRHGYQTLANAAEKLRSRSGNLTDRLRLMTSRGKGRQKS